MKQNKVIRTKKGDSGFFDSGVGVYTFEYVSQYKTASLSIPYSLSDMSDSPIQVGDFKIIPNGSDNSYPEELRNCLDENNILDTVINKKNYLLWGQGTALYEERFENGKRFRYWLDNYEIRSWLNSWDYEKYIEMCSAEFQVARGYFTKRYVNAGHAIGQKPFITELVCEPNKSARFEWPDEEGNINAIITSNFRKPWLTGQVRYPIWDKYTPFGYDVSMTYTSQYSFGLNKKYARASFHGAINNIRLASSIPILLMNYNINSAAIKFHLEIPMIYWDQKKAKLEEKCKRDGVLFTDEIWTKFQDDTIERFAQTLSNTNNVGKFAQTDTVYHEEAREFIGWKITPIDQKIKDFVDAQLEIAKQAHYEIASSLDLHPALSNVPHEGNLPSGSEQLYAYKLYLNTNIYLPELIILKELNDTIAVNFKKNIKIGFYHESVLTEEQTAPKDRVKNN